MVEQEPKPKEPSTPAGLALLGQEEPGPKALKGLPQLCSNEKVIDVIVELIDRQSVKNLAKLVIKLRELLETKKGEQTDDPNES